MRLSVMCYSILRRLGRNNMIFLLVLTCCWMKKQEQKHTSLPWFGIPRVIPYLKAYRWYYPVMILTALGGTLADIPDDICTPEIRELFYETLFAYGDELMEAYDAVSDK